MYQSRKLSLENTVTPTAETSSYFITMHAVVQQRGSQQNHWVWSLEEFGLFFKVFHISAWCNAEH